MPCPLQHGDVLHEFAVAAYQEMARNTHAIDLGEVRVTIRCEPVREQRVDPRPAELAGRQGYAVHDDELGTAVARAGVAVGRWHLARFADRSGAFVVAEHGFILPPGHGDCQPVTAGARCASMREVRIFSAAPLRPGETVELGAAPARHIGQVLRMRPGDELVVFDGRGGEYPAVIESCGRDRVQVVVGEHRPVERESPLQVSLWHGLCRGDRMDLVVQKAVELGVTRIRPVFTERGKVRLDARRGARKHAHWQGIAIAACEQSGRNRVPEILPPAPLAAALEDIRDAVPGFVLDPGGNDAFATGLGNAQRVRLLSGPEGGFGAAELELAVRAGFRPVHLGPRVLRTETAPVVALSLLQGLAGDLAPGE